MEHQFDELAKALAEGVSRREALRRLGGGLAGVLLAFMGLGKAWSQSGSVDCGSYCRARFTRRSAALRTCVHSCEDCQAGGGVMCGASSAGGGAVTCCSGGSAPTCCGGACVNTASDVNNCGGCAGAGGSICSGTQSCRNGTCTDTGGDVNNCGGQVCGSNELCCNETCTDITTTTDCGACGNACAPTQCVDNGGYFAFLSDPICRDGAFCSYNRGQGCNIGQGCDLSLGCIN
jgi:hypothetical protein